MGAWDSLIEEEIEETPEVKIPKEKPETPKPQRKTTKPKKLNEDSLRSILWNKSLDQLRSDFKNLTGKSAKHTSEMKKGKLINEIVKAILK
jgi:hypothetical protein